MSWGRNRRNRETENMRDKMRIVKQAGARAEWYHRTRCSCDHDDVQPVPRPGLQPLLHKLLGCIKRALASVVVATCMC